MPVNGLAKLEMQARSFEDHLDLARIILVIVSKLCARRVDALQRDIEVKRQIRLHIVVRLIAARWGNCLI